MALVYTCIELYVTTKLGESHYNILYVLDCITNICLSYIDYQWNINCREAKCEISHFFFTFAH